MRNEYYARAMQLAEIAASKVKGQYPEGTDAYTALAETIAQTGNFIGAYSKLKEGASGLWPYHNSLGFAKDLAKTAVRLAAKGHLEIARQAAKQLDPSLFRERLYFSKLKPPKSLSLSLEPFEPDLLQVGAFLGIATVSRDPQDIEQARTLAAKIRNALRRARAFCDIAAVSQEASDIQEAMGAAVRTSKSHSWALIVEKIALTCANIGDLRNVRAIAKKLPKEFGDDILQMATAFGKAEANPQGALETIVTIQDSVILEYGLKKIVDIMVSTGHFDLAITAASMIKEPELSTDPPVLDMVLQELLHKGEYEVVRRYCEEIADPFKKALGIVALAKKTHNPEDLKSARLLWTGLPDDFMRGFLDKDLIEAFANAGQFDVASELLDKIEDELSRSIGLSAMVSAYVDQGNLSEARLKASTIPHPSSKAWCFAKIATTSNEVNDFEAALRAAETIKKPVRRAKSLAEIASMWWAS